MAWICCYKVDEQTAKDLYKKMDKRLHEFCKRHNIDPVKDLHYEPGYLNLDECLFEYFNSMRNQYGSYPSNYWAYRKVVARALDHPHATGIAYGYVGYSAKD